MLGSSPAGIIWVGRTAASAADCKSVDFGHRQFESGPAHLCLRVREVEGAVSASLRSAHGVPRTPCAPLRRCAVTHRWFESTRKRYEKKQIRRPIMEVRFAKENELVLLWDTFFDSNRMKNKTLDG